MFACQTKDFKACDVKLSTTKQWSGWNHGEFDTWRVRYRKPLTWSLSDCKSSGAMDNKPPSLGFKNMDMVVVRNGDKHRRNETVDNLYSTIEDEAVPAESS